MENIVPIMFPLCLIWRMFSKGAGSFLFLEATNSIRAETILEINVAIPTPRAPRLKTRINIVSLNHRDIRLNRNRATVILMKNTKMTATSHPLF